MSLPYLLRSLAFTLLLTFAKGAILQAQVTNLAMPSRVEKQKIKTLIAEYLNILNGSSRHATSQKLLNAASSVYTSDSIQVHTDYDSTAAGSHLTTVSKYLLYLADSSMLGWNQNIDTAKLSYDIIKYDAARRWYYVQAKGIKVFSKKTIIYAPADSAGLDSTQAEAVVADSVFQSFSQKITFFITFKKAANNVNDFKIAAISKTGSAPVLPPLPAAMEWWLGLDPQWRPLLIKQFNTEEYPLPAQIDRILAVKELNLSHSNIYTLLPIVKFAALEKLNCSNTKIKSLEPVLKLKYLQVLNISRTGIDTLGGIDLLKSLKELECIGNKITSILPLKSLIQLEKLSCAENNLTDILPMQDLVNLKVLDFSLNPKIKSIEPIQNMVALEWLALGKIDVGDASAIKNLVNLVHLDLFNTNFTSLEPIRRLEKLMYLNLSHNKMTDLNSIRNYKFLTELYLSSSSIQDLNGVKNFQFLRVLDISNTVVSQLGPVHQLPDLKVLTAQYTKISKDEIQRFKKNHSKCQITYY